MNNLLCRADSLFFCASFPFALAAEVEKEWDFMENGSEGGGVFSSLIDTLHSIGSSGYELMMTIGVIGLAFSIIFTAVSLLTTSNAQKKEEKKSHALIICIAGVVIFSCFSIIGFFKSIGSGL